MPLAALIRRAGRLALRAFSDLAAGRTPRPRAPRPAAEAPRPRRTSAFPRTWCWLVRLIGWPAAGCASQLEFLLNQPEAAAALSSSLAARRALAPVRWMLGITPKRPRRPRPARPRPQPVAAAPPPLTRPSPAGWPFPPPPGPERPYWMPPKRPRRPPPVEGWDAFRAKHRHDPG